MKQQNYFFNIEESIKINNLFFLFYSLNKVNISISSYKKHSIDSDNKYITFVQDIMQNIELIMIQDINF